jgi:plasmid maintenance system antidote protein VapI
MNNSSPVGELQEVFMQFSAELLEMMKQGCGFKSDSELVEALPAITKGRVSEVKSGKRHLTEEQALVIAKACKLNPEWVLVNLAAETTKSEACKPIWSNLAKKLSKAALVFVVAGLLNSGLVPDLGKRVFLVRPRNSA